MLSKPKKITSKKIRNSARGETCTLRLNGICAGGTETVVLCHVNSFRKGMGNKSHDIHAVYACHHCHQALDLGNVDSSDILRALLESQDRMIQQELIEVT